MWTRYVRKSISIGCSCILLFLFVGVPTVYANNERSQAKTKFMEGVSLFSSDDYSGALDAFNESYRLSPKTGTLFNIAMCYKALYRYVDAIKAFRHFLDEVNRDEHPEKVENAEAALLELDELTGQLILIDTPIGASVTIDNSPIGTAPLDEPLILNPGRYQIEVSKAGFETLSTAVTVASGAKVRIRAALQSQYDQSSGSTVKKYQLPSEPSAGDTDDKESNEKTSTLFVLSLISGGMGIAAIGAGAYFNYQREVTDISDARAATDISDYRRIIERGEEHEWALTICYGVGGLFLVTGLLLYIVDETNQPTDSLNIVLDHDGVTLRF